MVQAEADERLTAPVFDSSLDLRQRSLSTRQEVGIVHVGRDRGGVRPEFGGCDIRNQVGRYSLG